MSKRKTMDKEHARARRNRLLASAAAAGLSLTEGVREMRAIAGMTQDEFARHREVSSRVIKAIELGQGNPTVATLNRIGQFFGLEVGFVPVRRTQAGQGLLQDASASSESLPLVSATDTDTANVDGRLNGLSQEMGKFMTSDEFRVVLKEGIIAGLRNIAGVIGELDNQRIDTGKLRKLVNEATESPHPNDGPKNQSSGESATENVPARNKKKTRAL